MKKITLYIGCLALGVVTLFTACEKHADKIADFTTTEGNAFLRVTDMAPYFRKVLNAPDSFNVYVNGAKVTAPFMTYLSVFPTTTNTYFAVPSGLQQIKLSAHGFATGKPDSTQILNFTKVFTTGQYYTLLITDSIKSLKDSAQMFLPDVYTKPTTGNYAIRFVHAVWNDTTGKNIDIYSSRRNANIFNNLKPGSITAFTSMPYNTQLNDTLYVRRTGTGFNLASGILGGGNQRVYTLVYRGDGDVNFISTASTPKGRGLGILVHQ